jgi:hypothetical protein
MNDSASKEEPVEEALVMRQRIVGWASLYPSPSLVELARAMSLESYQESVGFGLGPVPDYLLPDHRSCL